MGLFGKILRAVDTGVSGLKAMPGNVQLLTDAGRGDANAQNTLGMMFFSGQPGWGKDLTEAQRYFQMAAEQGHPNAQSHLYIMYMTGLGKKKDIAQGLYWLNQAAGQGYHPAQCQLGKHYAHGDEAVPKDTQKALFWLRLSAAQGNPLAQTALSEMQ